VDITARDRVALLRHGRGRAAVGDIELARLAHFRLHHQLEVSGELGERAGQKPEEAPRLGDAVALGMPGDLGLREPELVRQRLLHRQPVVAKGRKRTRGAAELDHLDARADLGEPRPMALQGGEQARHLEAECDRNRLLQVGAGRHRRRAMIPG
jgi:hypothetical protein